MIISEQFLKSIPIGKKEVVFNKLMKFEEQLLKYENKIRELPAGYWVRAIKNTEIFKFRLNNKDRLLFAYINKRDTHQSNSSNILFLSYVNHDEQIRVGKNIKLDNIMDKTMEINPQGYVEDDTDDIIDKTIINDFDYGKVDMNKLPSIVVNSNELSLLADELNKDYLYYLSDEQYDVIKALDNPVLLSGAGGTGKTVVLVNALALASENKEKSIYISYNKLLVENIKTLYGKFIDTNMDESNCDFYSLKELEQELVEEKQNTIITNLEI